MLSRLPKRSRRGGSANARRRGLLSGRERAGGARPARTQGRTVQQAPGGWRSCMAIIWIRQEAAQGFSSALGCSLAAGLFIISGARNGANCISAPGGSRSGRGARGSRGARHRGEGNQLPKRGRAGCRLALGWVRDARLQRWRSLFRRICVAAQQ
ncbi:unnamed protein product [Amoebophrya sp. A120]|nr:unnamed protein product [Amoebophrya sp. A120]|eukprot:GSA120T00017772001.1